MDITPGMVFTVKNDFTTEGEDCYADSYWIDSVKLHGDVLSVWVRQYGYLGAMSEGADLVRVGYSEIVMGDGVICQDTYAVLCEPLDGAIRRIFNMSVDAQGEVTILDMEAADVVWGLGVDLYWSPNLTALSTEVAANVAATRESLWFHATERENWADDALGCQDIHGRSFMIHAGSREAALSRMVSEDVIGRDFQLFSLKLHDDAKVYHEVIADQGEAWNGFLGEHMMGADAFVYENDFEDNGSVSLSAPLSCFDIVNVETMRIDNPEAAITARSHNRSLLVLTEG